MSSSQLFTALLRRWARFTDQFPLIALDCPGRMRKLHKPLHFWENISSFRPNYRLGSRTTARESKMWQDSTSSVVAWIYLGCAGARKRCRLRSGSETQETSGYLIVCVTVKNKPTKRRLRWMDRIRRSRGITVILPKTLHKSDHFLWPHVKWLSVAVESCPRCISSQFLPL